MWQAYSGQGRRVLLLVHGCLACADQYVPLARQLLPYYRRVWLLDLPGFGVTPPLSRPGLTPYLAWLAVALQALAAVEQQPVEVVGHSFGAFLLQASLHAHRQTRPAVRKLVLVSMGGLYRQLHRGWSDLWRTVWWGLFFRYRLLGDPLRSLLHRVPLLLQVCPQLRCIAGALHGERLLSSCIEVGWMHVAWGHPAAASLASLPVPLAMVWGHEDAVFPCWQAQTVARASGVPLLCLAGCGHQPLLEPEGATLLRLALLRATTTCAAPC